MKIVNSIIFGLIFIIQINGQTTKENLNQFDSDGKTALLRTITNKEIDKAKSLLQKGADVNLAEKNGLQGSPLMYAASTGNMQLCKLLIDHGANTNQLDINEDHALNWATYYGYVDIINLLINSGTDLTIKSKHGTAVDVAFRLWHHDSVAEVFRSTKLARTLAKTEFEFIKSLKLEDYKKLEKLIKKGVSPNLKDEIGVPVLQLAAQSGNENLVKFLISKGANINCLNEVGQTPLSWAARFGHKNIVQYLIDSGADTNLTDKTYQLTPLIGAAIGGHDDVGKLLIDNHAEIDHKDVINNAEAIHWAILNDHTDFILMLIKKDVDYHSKALENNMYSAYDMAKNYKKDALLKLMDSLDASKRKSKLIGSWKVQEIHYQYQDTIYTMKDEDHGRFIFSNQNYALMYNPRMQARKPFVNLSKPEPEEISYAFASIVFNTGSYVLNNNIITTTADIAKVPGFEGGNQFYTMNLSDDTLELVMHDETYPDGKKPDWFGKLKIKFILKKEQKISINK